MSILRSSTLPLPSDVERALTAAHLHQDSIQHADNKIARLAGLYGVLATLMVDNFPTRLDFTDSPWLSVMAGLTGIVFISSFVAGARQLVLGFRPVVAGPAGPNRFGFTDLQLPAITPDADHERAEAWHLASWLGQLARRKHHRVRAALPWTFGAVAATASWLALNMLL